MPDNESILDHPRLAARLFYPWPNRFPDPFFIAIDAVKLGCWYRQDAPEGLTLIHFHGNGETVGEYRGQFADTMATLGVNLLLAEYRGYGMSEGEPKLAEMLADIPAIVAASGADPSRLIFFGRSLGSLYAAHAAALYPGAAGLILESGIAELLELITERVAPRHLGATEEELRTAVEQAFNQQRKLAGFRGRTLVMHTRNDDIVPAWHGEKLADWVGGPKELVIFERGDHNNIREVNEQSYFSHIGKLVRQCEVSGISPAC